MNPLRDYVTEAIRRISERETEGSHASGVYNKAANRFEKEFAAFAIMVTQTTDVEKSTLGQLVYVLQKMPPPHPPTIAQLIAEGKAINNVWKKVKHGNDPPVEQLLTGLRAMLRALPLLQKKAAD